MTVTIRNSLGEAIRTSKNLRGVTDHLRDNRAVGTVTIIEHEGGLATLEIVWENGDYCAAEFQSLEVCKQWCAARRKLPPAIVIAK